MNKNIKIIIALLLVLTLSGCTKTLKDKDNNIIRYEKTGQNLTSNILCQPTEKEVKELYIENGVDIEKLVKCPDFKITTGGYEGLWTTFFVKPLAYVILKLGQLVKNYGLALIFSGILIRTIVNPITKKSATQAENMKKAKPELDSIEKKYKNKKDQDAMMKKTQEVLLVYKKYNINPIFGCLFALIQLPLFFAFLEAINRIPAIFESKLLSLQLGTTLRIGLFEHGNILYGLLIILMVAATYYSFQLTMASTSDEQAKQMKTTIIFMMIFISFASLGLPSAISIYWVTSSLYTIIQNILIKRRTN